MHEDLLADSLQLGTTNMKGAFYGNTAEYFMDLILNELNIVKNTNEIYSNNRTYVCYN